MAIWVKPGGLEIEINDRDCSLEMAVSLGWKLKESEPDIKNDGDKGNGEPGSKQWHEAAIKGMSDAASIQEYMLEIGIEMNASGNLRSIKRNAIKLIAEAVL